ncbi:hypothetical protein Bca52824_076823 [Brassica carinata]|uniref:Uncharacterized protein n=1 Tax=Brassica carinata TaxID=52824 RepID=A0A8X7PXU8_BRACI|nr:hypothetical protein Bca52824_076823 [Brassica carinata]
MKVRNRHPNRRSSDTEIISSIGEETPALITDSAVFSDSSSSSNKERMPYSPRVTRAAEFTKGCTPTQPVWTGERNIPPGDTGLRLFRLDVHCPRG